MIGGRWAKMHRTVAKVFPIYWQRKMNSCFSPLQSSNPERSQDSSYISLELQRVASKLIKHFSHTVRQHYIHSILCCMKYLNWRHFLKMHDSVKWKIPDVLCIILHMQPLPVIHSDILDIFRILTRILNWVFCLIASYAWLARGSTGFKRLKDPHLHDFDPSCNDVSCEFYFIKIYVSL